MVDYFSNQSRYGKDGCNECDLLAPFMLSGNALYICEFWLLKYKKCPDGFYKFFKNYAHKLLQQWLCFVSIT